MLKPFPRGVMYRIFLIEVIKTKNTLVLLGLICAPILVAFLKLMMHLKSHGGHFSIELWGKYWMGTLAIWCYFVFPMLIALVTSLINGIEHRNNTWNYLFSLPLEKHQIFIGKLLVAALFLMLSTFILYALSFIAALAVGFEGGSITPLLDTEYLYQFLTVFGAMLPILLIQHSISWYFTQPAIALALGILAPIGIITIGMSEYWVYYPWSYLLMATLGGDMANRDIALQLAITFTLVFGVVLTYASAKIEQRKT